jgi:uncharacterized membrane protein YfcA
MGGYRDPVTLAAVLVIVFVATLCQSTVGFGAALIATPLVVQLDPDLVPGPVMVATCSLNLLVLIRERQAVTLRPILLAIAGAGAGTTLAVLTLRQLSDEGLSVLIGLCVLVMVLLAAAGRTPDRSGRNLTAAGIVSGFSGSAAGIGGPPVALLFHDAEVGELRASLAGYFLALSALSFTGLHVAGRFGAGELADGARLLPAVIVAFVASKPLLPLIQQRVVRPTILALSAGAAVVLLSRALLG